ncbi:MAG: dockerin type I domain-containing protein [Oryzomonas sp.]|uniref:dockerin type I domain-containing protein n=1 Tax=Oryzomonas sp. TaxID=2855186 RepID=UPI002848DB15|nr:dockerin type I domain-containing protein [Oryzomonas sp.]MDR3580431.1 dockerin type I domain-containing protein [Oryzomonas sp.]
MTLINKELSTSPTGSGTVWELTLPDGTVYTFEWATGNAGYSITFGNILGAPTQAIAQVTKIRNAAGTSVITMSYYRDPTTGLSYLKTITDSANRVITLNYNYTSNTLTSINVDKRTFNYGYTTTNSNNYLTSFTPPTGNAWSYGYGPSDFELTSIGFPTGGSINYTYNDILFATGGAATYVKFRVIASRSTTGRGITGGTWTYSYNSGNAAGDTTTITAPGVTEVHKFYGWGNTGTNNVWKVGLPMSKAYSGSLTQTETYSWSQGTQISTNYLANANWGSGVTIFDLGIYVPFFSSKIITRDGQSFTSSYSNPNSYNDPQTIAETGTRNRSRTLTYFTNSTNNIVKGKIQSETVTGSYPGTSTSSWVYDSTSGNVKQSTINDVTTNYGFDGNGNLASVIDANSYNTTYLWSNGKISNETNPIYSVTRVINSNGTIYSETNGRGFTTSYTYDNNLRLASITPPVGNSTTISYAPDSSTRTETRGGHTTTYTFDGFGRSSGSSDSIGITTTTAYNAYGVKSLDESSIGDTVAYDYFGRISLITHQDGSTFQYNYNLCNQTLTDENGAKTTLDYDCFGSPSEKYLISVVDPYYTTSYPTSYTRNILGNITNISQGSVARTFNYDPLKIGFLASEVSPEFGTITYVRDNVGNMKSKSDSSGTKNYIYDSINRLKTITSGNSTITYGYDNANNRTSMSSPASSTTFGYDGANRLQTIQDNVNSTSSTISYVYDDNDNIITITYPSSRIVTYGYNSNNQNTSITGYVSTASYYTSGVNAGQPQSYSLANGVSTSLDFNTRQQITGISSSALDIGYGYDTRGNTKTLTDNLDATNNQNYDYDSLNRLTTFDGSWGSGIFTYDNSRNRFSKNIAGSNTIYSYTNNLLSSTTGGEQATYSYNGNGTLFGGTWQGASYTLLYDAFDRVSNVASGATQIAGYAYDGDGMRVTKTENGFTTIYHYDRAGRVMSENDLSGNLIADYVYLNGKLISKIVPVPTNITISENNSGCGTVSPSGSVVVGYGNSQQFTFTASTGSRLAGVLLDDVPQQVAITNPSSITLSNLYDNHILSTYFSFPDGDVNADGNVTAVDALLALRAAVNLIPTTPSLLAHADVAPLTNGYPAPDGQITAADALIILRKAVGLNNWTVSCGTSQMATTAKTTLSSSALTTNSSSATLSIASSGNGSYTIQGNNLNGIAAIQLTIAYDSTMLGSPTVSTGSLISGSTMLANTTSPGSITIGILSTSAFSGSGQIATINFGTWTSLSPTPTMIKYSLIDINGNVVSSY